MYFISCCSVFKDQCRAFRSSACPVFHRAMLCRFFATAYLLYHFLFGLSRVFSKVFLKFFRSFILTFDSTPRLPKKRYLFAPSFWALDYYITFLSVCQGVFQKFFSDFFSSVFWKPFLLSVGLDFS